MDREEAGTALRRLRKLGFRRSAIIQKTADGQIKILDPLLSRRIFAAAFSALFCGGLTAFLFRIFPWTLPALGGTASAILSILAAASIGVLFGFLHIRRSRSGVERSILGDYSRWLAAEETVLLLQAPIGLMRGPVAVLRENGEVPPAVFVLNPKIESLIVDTGNLWTPVPAAEIRERIRRFAMKNSVDPHSRRNTILLDRLKKARKWIHLVCSNLTETALLDQRTTPITEWILDNEHVIESNVQDVRRNLSRRFYKSLPMPTGNLYRGMPRIYSLAKDLVSYNGLRIDGANIVDFIEAYQSVRTLTIAELWALPQMLRIALIESIMDLAARGLTELRDREIADFWANRLITAGRRDSGRLYSIMAMLTENRPNPSPYFAFQLIDRLYDEEDAGVLVRNWLERIYRRPVSELNLREQDRQTKDHIAVAGALTSLRQLALLDWRQIFEQVSKVEKILRLDPLGIYAKMDFATRDRYRRAIEEMAHASDQSEETVAQGAVDLAAGAVNKAAEDERWIHVGTYLIGKGRTELSRHFGGAEVLGSRVRQWVYRRHSAVYFFGIGIFSAVFLSLIVLFGLGGQKPAIKLLISFLALIPVSQLALDIVNYLIMRLLPPRALAKLDFKDSGIPDDFRTLVVVPMMLEDQETVAEEVDKLEIRYLANKEANLLFGLLTDYTDSDEAHIEEDGPLFQAAIARIESLNSHYGAGVFFLFHRERIWSESEQKHIGWERKRGKLEELNRLIDGTRPESAGRMVYVGDPDHLTNVRFVITLDSDTQLPSGTARRMIETLAHPLNRPRFNADGEVAEGSYTIIQPRVSPSLPSMSASFFSRLFAYAVGIDPYTRVVSDVNQDLTGEGSYQGKGIYDVRAFSRVLSGKFPEERLLSHDLIEGAHVRVGLASDIELIDEFPRDYLTYARRQHRWIRGDWQISDWILPWVPGTGGGLVRNKLSLFNRWKILDNLRRSLIPLASLGLFAAVWLLTEGMEWVPPVVIGTQMIFHALAQPLTMATTRKGLRDFSLAKFAHDLLRTVVEVSLLPHQTWLAVNAILRVWYRRLFSHRNMLEWTSARLKRRSVLIHLPAFMLFMGLISLLSAFAGWAVYHWTPANMFIAAPWLLLWFLSPLTGRLLNLPPRTKRQVGRLSAEERMFLRKTARRTWRFFSDFISDDTSWLPPDNYQVYHQDRLAMRTSPTNIGLWMLSALGARDFGYLTGDQVVEALVRTMKTIAKLERFEGHLLNWYDIQTLRPLEPRYISTVDSGNLLGALWVLQQGLAELLQRPVLEGNLFDGLQDTLEVAKESAKQWSSPVPNAGTFTEILSIGQRPWENIGDALRRLGKIEKFCETMTKKEDEPRVDAELPANWTDRLHGQIRAWLAVRDRYLSWIEILGEKTEEEIAGLGEEAVLAFRRGIPEAPSLGDLAEGKVPCISALKNAREHLSITEGPLLEWLDRVISAFDTSKWLAGEMKGQVEGLIGELRELSESINMRFLYDEKRKLFTIGFNVSDRRRDNSFYDLLASEARIGSFIAIARGEIPMEHWFALARPFNAVGRHRMLLSWTGTMFEYLMPLLFQRSFENSLLHKAVHEAVAVQIAYGRKRRVPWGISECAFTDLDINKTYQYKAFGVPELGLKREGEEELVVAPYAGLLAVGIAPKKTVKNLKRLAALGLLDEYGFYEAIDFARQASREGGRGVIVRAYMSHHQSMGFLSLNNFLHNNPVQRHFHLDPRVRAFEPLLQESIPLHTSRYLSARQKTPSSDNVEEIIPSISKFDSPHTGTPRTQLLGNGRYSLMLTNTGGGYSQWGGFEITRWRSDPTRDPWGTFCYIREAEGDRLWSATYQPTAGRVESYSAGFATDRAVFQRLDNGIETETEIVVSSEDDVEIRRTTFVNRTMRKRYLEFSSYIELSLAPHKEDLQHPAFNKLFIHTEAVPEHEALIAYRRPRGEADLPVFAAHRFTPDKAEEGALRFETDRRAFIGRGRTLERPGSLFSEPRGGQGFVLDPVFSLRRTIVLGPGERTQISLVLAAGETREGVLALMDKYGDPHAIDRAMDFAWASAQLELRLLRIQPDEARRFQEIAAHLLFPNPRLRPSPERIEENRKGQAGLWPYGISGDVPIILVTIEETWDIGLVRQLLKAHSYWRMHGFKADLVIINEEARGYEEPLRKQLEALLRTHGGVDGAENTGKIFLLSMDRLPEEDLTLLMAAARVVLVAARGTLSQQLGTAAEIPGPPKYTPKKKAPQDPSAQLPFLELDYFNGLGGFTPGGREYAIYLGSGTHTPAPWVNVMANPGFGTLIGETGQGFSWYGNSQRNRLTDWSNDPVTDPSSEAIYIRDEETGVFWTPTASPIREGSAYRARHGAGYTVFEHNSNGIAQELTVFVPVDDDGGEPIKLQRLRLRNETSRTRNLSITYYLEWTLGENRESSQMHVVTSWDDEAHALLAHNRYHPEYGDRVAFASINPPTRSYGGDRASFVGRNRSLARPAAMERSGLSSRLGPGLDPCSALQTTLQIEPGETTEIICMLGQAASINEVHKLVYRYRDGEAFETGLESTKAWWDSLLGKIQVETPELAANILINRWLLYQSLSCRMWGRSASYQSGGAFGFRDQLQDSMAFFNVRSELGREYILRAAGRQFKEGDVQHWWHPPSGAGIRSRISDDLLWLPHAVAGYVRATGDKGILDAVVPFLDLPPLEKDQHEVFATPKNAAESGTLFEHCLRSVSRGFTSGAHGLPLMGTGDWNDGMNLVGAAGRGESVWLAWFIADVLQGMMELSGLQGRPDLRKKFEGQRKVLVRNIESSAWDGEWYLRAFFDNGEPLGSSANQEAKIDSLPQSWAVLSGAAGEERARTAIQSARDHLVLEEEGLVLLFEPPFELSEPSPGYIKGYPPGVRENGGQYTHAALWFAMALARRGDGKGAASMLRMLNPIERTGNPEAAERYRVEPYVIAADVYRLPGHVGQGGWSWYTGSASWMYRAWTEEALGLKIRGDEMRLDPVIPGNWPGFSLRYTHGEAVYEVRVENPEGRERGVSRVEMDGRLLPGGTIPLERAPVLHRVLVRMGDPDPKISLYTKQFP
jgi:cyclic beta-1,2-glucan synthetase